jgi:hypothetical protein
MNAITLAAIAALPLAAAQQYAAPTVSVVATDSTGGYPIKAHTTYRLSLTLAAGASNVYTIFGESTSPMIIPPAYQVPTPFGAAVGGVDPLFFGMKPEAKYDSWITVGITTGDSKSALGKVGIADDKWTETAGMRITDGAVFWMDPLKVRFAEPNALFAPDAPTGSYVRPHSMV